MEKEYPEDGEALPPELNQVKEQIERERFLHINEKFDFICKPSVATHALQHQLLALTRCNREGNNGRDNNMLSSRIKTPLHHFDGFSYDSHEADVPVELPSVNFPFVRQLPRSITWAFVDSNQLMAESDSVIGKKQIHYVDGEAVELKSDNETNEEDEEETENEKLEFSEDVDRLIWKIGQEHSLDDLVVQSALSKFLELDVSDILERYNELNKLKKEENIVEVFDKSIVTCFTETTNRLFCRRCLIYDCHLHEEYQPVMKTREKYNLIENIEDVTKQCSEHCYLKPRSDTEDDHVADNDNSISNMKGKDVVSDTNTETEKCWTPVEKDLYLKGVEIFGRNSCLIRKNLLDEFKTCLEVYNYMREQDPCTMLLERNETDNRFNKEVSRKKARLVRRKARLQKYACNPPAFKKGLTNETYKQYTPCTCEPLCGDQCPCLTIGNCCEKYCGCPKICNNRFGGCNCAKGQCINRQCPCFAVSRECDPDICRSCCLSCGDGSLGEKLQTSQCKNMKFLIKENKKILLAESDVHGWGAFTPHSLKKNEFLGEYTGELISHDEANERGKGDFKLGYSYLFTLNDQFVIDARRKGNKFRFLNHSATPNCYAKLMIVRGDHRIGLFAAKAIEEGEELFFDYGYGPGHSDWARSAEPRKSDKRKKSGGSKKFSKNIGPSESDEKRCR
ncbi:histone-lysine N-methyltransferase MEDEA [Eutrema salsugineum]|uniref:histone-lysine N-methyltransferase MEDEA n=1 Tax=Eutrema salsugineum TaxID=72664 RepID=UPI000CED160E|nr:histone-lysine N-methyltransferase MEDEA [Eutrema salsugineum]